MRRQSTFVFVLALMAALIAACEDEVLIPEHVEDPWPTPRANAEAELAAAWLSGEVLAPTGLYDSLVSELALIRSTYGDSIEATGIPFEPYWAPGKLLLSFDAAAFALVEGGAYDAWDTANERYHLTDIETIPDYRLVILEYFGRVNPNAIVADYAGLPGVQYVTPAIYPGDRSVALIGEGYPRLCMFRQASGGCNPECTVSVVWYVEVSAGGVEYPETETYTPTDTSGERWPLFREAMERYRALTQWPPLGAAEAEEMSRPAASVGSLRRR